MIAPLDWGLGHTTRCVPIIRELRALGHTVVVAGNDWQCSFLGEVFPGIEVVPLEGYNVTYSATDALVKTTILAQVPRLYNTVARENQWLAENLPSIRPDAIISDNRYGLYHPSIPSVFITHQLLLQSGAGSAVNRAVQRLHYMFIRRFGQVWVPDVASRPGIAGELSHPHRTPAHTTYIGPLSQFTQPLPPLGDNGHLLVLLSGPEPQRTILATVLWQQLCNHSGPVVFVAGNDRATPPVHIPAHITYHSRLSGPQLTQALSGAAMVVCRAGYSTIMDLLLLGRKAIIVPTPGQTEQEYLAGYLSASGVLLAARQRGFQLATALQQAATFPYTFPAFQPHYSDHKAVIKTWLQTI